MKALRQLLRRLFGPSPRVHFRRVVLRLDTPEKVNAYMQLRFDYVTDTIAHGIDEVWHSPYATFIATQGDCEDWALFAWHALTRHGYRARIFAAFDGEDGHAVCVFEHDGAWGTLCNEGLRRLAVTLDEGLSEAEALSALAPHVAAKIYPAGWTRCAFVSCDALRVRFAKAPRLFMPHYEWVEDRSGDL